MLNQTPTRIRRWYARSIAYRLYIHSCIIVSCILLCCYTSLNKSLRTPLLVQRPLVYKMYIYIYICIFSILCAWQACHMWVLTDLQLSFWGVGLLELDLNWGEFALTLQDLHVYTGVKAQLCWRANDEFESSICARTTTSFFIWLHDIERKLF